MSQQNSSTTLLHRLRESSTFPQIYTYDPLLDKESIALGIAQEYKTIPKAVDQRIWHMRDFAERKTDLWDGFPSQWIFRAESEEELFSPEIHPKALPKCTSLSHTPSLDAWKKSIEAFYRSDLDKVVLGRKSQLTFDEQISPYDLLEHIHPNGFVFGLILSPTHAFVGATPEMLYKRHNTALVTEAIAGTRRRGKEPSEDLALEKQLCWSKKDQRECGFVRDSLIKDLSSIATGLQAPKRYRIKKTPNVQHLHLPISATIKNVNDEELIRLLHPTPAMGGYPKQEALRWLTENEAFDRGWYAAPFGYVENERAVCYVTIRSALIRNQQLHLFAAAGIVAGSIATEEWKELDAKMSMYTRLFPSDAKLSTC